MGKILIACEESQTIANSLRAAGFEAYSCDILECTGGHPEWHIKGDALIEAYSGKYDAMIAHPPCTYLAVSGARWMYNKDGSVNLERLKKQNDALDFVKKLMDAPIKRIAIENPISVISTYIRKPDQIVQPYFFGDKASKSTCLWLDGFPLLQPTDIVEKGEFKEFINKKTGRKNKQPMWYYNAFINSSTPEERSRIRSKTFQGFADAIVKQWFIDYDV